MKQADNTLELDPNFASAYRARARLYDELGQPKLALEAYEKAAKLSQDATSLSALAHAYAASGQRVKAIRIVEQLESAPKEKYVSPYEIAPVFVALGEKDRALSLLEQSLQEHDSRMPFLAVDGWLAPLHSEARFVALEEKVGLPHK